VVRLGGTELHHNTSDEQLLYVEFVLKMLFAKLVIRSTVKLETVAGGQSQ